MMDRKTLLALSLCFLIYVGWFQFFASPLQPPPSASSSSPSQGSLQSSLPQSTNKADASSSESFSKDTPLGPVTLGNAKYWLQNWTLSQYKKEPFLNAQSIDLAFVTQANENLTLSFDLSEYAFLNQVQGRWITPPSETSLEAVWKYEDEKIRLVREFFFSPEKPTLQLRFSVAFQAGAPLPRYAFLTLQGKGFEKDPEAQDRQIFYHTQNHLERVLLKDAISPQDIRTPIDYLGIASRYFLLALIPASGTAPYAFLQPGLEPFSAKVHLVFPITQAVSQWDTQLFFGPKEVSLLKTVLPSLEETIDFGWFTWFAYPLLQILKWIYGFFGNYGVAIILLTLLLKIATYPLTQKSMQSMKKMAQVQPEIEALRKHYANDKEALNREMLKLMREKGYNPAAGCLPLLLQMPIFFALYRVLYSSVELYHAPFIFWIRDLSAQDPYYVTPVLLTLTLWLQQRLTPNTATDPMQAKMMQWMPLIFGAFMMTLPSGLALYMWVNALASILQQVILTRKGPTTARIPEVLP